MPTRDWHGKAGLAPNLNRTIHSGSVIRSQLHPPPHTRTSVTMGMNPPFQSTSRSFSAFRHCSRVQLKLFGLSLIVVSAVFLSAHRASAQEPGQTYTEAEAARGTTVYVEQCAQCHGSGLSDGSAPALIGPTFRRTWSRPQVTVNDLHYIVSTTMPPSRPGSLSDAQYLDVLAYIMAENGVAAGAEPLSAEQARLESVSLLLPDDVAVGIASAFIQGARSVPIGTGPSVEELVGAEEDAANWLFHTGNFSGTRYSPLSEIDVDNVANLRPVCLFQLSEARNFQTGPIVYDGIMYFTGVRTTVAIDAATCRMLWRHTWQPRDREVWNNNRGVGIQDGYVVRGTADGYLMALDAADGEFLWARQIADPWIGETFTMAPMVYDDLVLIGPAGSENGISGWVGAFRLRDGEQVWKFQTVPGATREGSESWGNPLSIPLGGGAVWTPFTLDVARGELYVAVGNPAPDFPAELRPGLNLYTNSIVALDVRTGALRWYEQLVPSDEHDWDLTQVSPIFSRNVGGAQQDLVTTVGKDGIIRLLDRETRERLFETPITTLENVDAPVTTDGTRACPGVYGGVEWNGPAYHPGTGTLVTPTVDWCTTFTEFQPDEVRYVDGQLYMGGTYEMDTQATGWITSVNTNDGSVRWRYHSERPVVGAVSATAGGLVFAGELTGDFLAFSADSGEVLYRFNTGGPIGAGVVSYSVEGRQYVAVGSGRPSGFWWGDHQGSGTIVVFGLP
ncbi:MAG TPA: pyrrolo-quinoline quinone [Gemmatimonadetes bacterium]|nr:pyrrolo-quinoline quinone [Gemmatimonadota bacterium]